MRKLGILLCIVASMGIVLTTILIKINGEKSQQLIEVYRATGDNIVLPQEELEAISQIETLGILQIPAIGVELPILEGDKKEQLALGAGHAIGTKLPGEIGNCVIAGHRSYTFGQYFNRLDEVQIGDEINIETSGRVWSYQVYEKLRVTPEEVWLLEDIEGETTVTLITCDPIVNATHRLIVRGRIIEQ